MNAPPQDLTFAIVDDIAFSAASANPNARGAGASPTYVPNHIGPFVELALLEKQGRLRASGDRHLSRPTPFEAMLSSPQRNVLVELGGNSGFMRMGASAMKGTELTRLSIAAKRAASAAGFGDRAAGQLAAALLELHGNIVEHSEAVDSGLLGYQALDGHFEFIVADQGVGALASLRTNERFSNLATDREALPLVLQDGCSRFSDPARGRGFNDIFRGLANHNGALRFRSGEAAILIDGQSPTAIKPKVKKKSYLQGFLASVRCSS
jgi:hypothetical protein